MLTHSLFGNILILQAIHAKTSVFKEFMTFDLAIVAYGVNHQHIFTISGSQPNSSGQILYLEFF